MTVNKETKTEKRGRGRPKSIDRKSSTKMHYDIPLLHKGQMVEIAEKENTTQTESFIKMVQEAYHAHFGGSDTEKNN